eukprot:4944835-Karenia_brevis.AAC.1
MTITCPPCISLHPEQQYRSALRQQKHASEAAFPREQRGPRRPYVAHETVATIETRKALRAVKRSVGRTTVRHHC